MDPRRHAPATARNSEPLALVLAEELPTNGRVLEITSGSGEHALFMANRFPDLEWQPSDQDTAALASIEAWRAGDGPRNLMSPIEIDASAEDWPQVSADAILCVNMIHIAPWSAARGLFAAAGRLLAEGAPLILYGPYLEEGVVTTQSNVEFDRSLKDRNPAWGLRNLSAVDDLAKDHGFTRTARHPMPANNLTVVYRKPA